jgi:NADH-quinone oxidoreductase subunit F
VLTTLRYFREEYEEHIEQHFCRAGQCKALTRYHIDAALCKGCGLCVKKCPANCITGERGKPYTRDAERCVKCGGCANVCKFGAVVFIPPDSTTDGGAA